MPFYTPACVARHQPQVKDAISQRDFFGEAASEFVVKIIYGRRTLAAAEE